MQLHCNEITSPHRGISGYLLNLFVEKLHDSSGIRSQKILPYSGTEDQLVSDVISDAKDEELFVGLPCHGKDNEQILELLNDIIMTEVNKIEQLMKQKLLSKEERTIAILVRSNWQVENVVKAAKNSVK